MLSYGVNQERLIQNLQISLIVFLIKILLLIFVISKRVKLIKYSLCTYGSLILARVL